MNEPREASSYAPRTIQAGSHRGRSLRRWLVPGLALLALAGHWLFAYAPRERAGIPSPPFASRLDGEGGWERVLWLAHPHQNLGAVDERLGSLDDYLGELARVAEVEAPRLPHFGPFAVPPSSELLLAWNDADRSLLGMARIHRGLGLFARLAGRLAGNPWLAGGRARSGDRTYDVRWEGPLWIVSSAGATTATGVPEPRTAPALSERSEMLAEFRTRRATGPVMPGNYRLARYPDGIELRGGQLPEANLGQGDAASAAGALRLDLPQLALWVALADRAPIGGPGLFLLWEDADSVVPRVATLQRGGGRTFRLPGEKLLELVGKAEPARRLGWEARGTDSQARREALRIVPWLENNYPLAADRDAWLAAAGRLAPRRATALLERLAQRLRSIPLVPSTEIARVEAGASLLRPLSDCSRVTFEVWRNPDGMRVRLCPHEALAELDSRELESSFDPSSTEDTEIDERARFR